MLDDGLAGSPDVAQNSHTPSPIRLGKNFSDVALPCPKRLGLSVQSNQSFRQHHAMALMTVLHKFLLQGDYLRAGRTWGILLRMRVATGSMNLRAHDHWGLGAEILYHQHSQLISNIASQEGEPLVDGNDETENSPLKSFFWFNPEGFKEAQEYYERLILQYPYQKQFRNRVNALDFYPAMFGLWVYSVQQQHEIKLQHRGEPDPKIKKEQPSEVAQSGEKTSVGLEMEEGPRIAEAHTVYVDRAREIQNRLDALLLSPPFSDSVRLCNLQSMVNQWVTHISYSNVESLEITSAKEDDEIRSTGSHWMDS